MYMPFYMALRTTDVSTSPQMYQHHNTFPDHTGGCIKNATCRTSAHKAHATNLLLRCMKSMQYTRVHATHLNCVCRNQNLATNTHLLLVGELGVNDVVITGLLGVTACWPCPSAGLWPCTGTWCTPLVHGLAHLHHHLLQGLHLLLHAVHVIGIHCVAQLLDASLNGGLELSRQLGLKLLQLLLSLVDHALSLVLGIHGLTALLILIGELLSLLDHALDIILGQGGGAGDLDILLLARALVGGSHAQDTVGINIKLDLNLGHTARSRGDAVEAEGAQGLVVARKLALTLQDVDLHTGLAVSSSGEDLAL
mmetsp:Transcript_28887/g.63667  ORF Transcript_28887/g.63667 Transcript_28887/m.63667 type:complete len:309 (-) Transcript_28887:38-964(-)